MRKSLIKLSSILIVATAFIACTSTAFNSITVKENPAKNVKSETNFTPQLDKDQINDNFRDMDTYYTRATKDQQINTGVEI